MQVNVFLYLCGCLRYNYQEEKDWVLIKQFNPAGCLRSNYQEEKDWVLIK
jgi:hypothetical protein